MIDRRWTGVAVCLVLCLTAGSPPARAAEPARTTVYVVRHAEAVRLPERSADPPLTEAGMAQAADLRDVLAAAPIAAVYSTPYQRTVMTAGPTAGAAGLKTMRYEPGALGKPEGLPGRAALMSAYPDAAILVVGHSNTVAQIVAALGGDVDGVEIEHDEYDNLFVVDLRGEKTRVRRHRYGRLTATRRLAIAGQVVGKGDDGRDSVSGVALVGDNVVICPDEGTCVQELLPDAVGYAAQPGLELSHDSPRVEELDLEGLASGPKFLYAVGSHSSKRKTARESGYGENRDRLATVVRGGRDQRDRLFRIPIGSGRPRPEGAVALDLRPLFENDRWLHLAAGIPGKENGIDVEGLALDGDWLVLGLRGPVLRGNLTPLVRVRPDDDWKKVKAHRVSFVDLEGRGVRGLARCSTGFLLIAGPVGDARDPHRLYHWDGEDMLPGERKDGDASKRVGRLTLLGTIPAAPGTSAEGIALRGETDAAFSVLVVFDGAPNGAPTEFRVRKVPGL